jgi:1-acyl-sn-glycerol-3-phosphate acyltransferase
LKLTYFSISKLLRWYYHTRIFLPPEITNLRKGRYIIVANHRKVIDPFLILATLPYQTYNNLLPVRSFTANVYMDHIAIGLFAPFLGCFRAHAVDGKVSGVKSALQLSDRGQTIFIFPEGKRVKPNTQVAPKIGVAYLTQKRDFTILPVHVNYTKKRRRYMTSVTWGKPFTLSKKRRNTDLQNLTEYIFRHVQKLSS